MARKTIADLEYQIRTLEPYREAVICFQRGEKPIRISCDGCSVDVLGLSRASGGVIVAFDGEPGCATWVSDWTCQPTVQCDPYRRSLANRILTAQKNAMAD